MRKAVSVAVIALVLGGTLSASAGSTREESRAYRFGSNHVVTLDGEPVFTSGIALCGRGPEGEDVGGSCFSLAGNEVSVSLSITDEAGFPVGARYRFWIYTGDIISGSPSVGRSFCGSIADLAVPDGFNRLTVYYSSPPFASCGGASAGTLRAVFALAD